MPKVHVNGIDLYYEIHGAGHPLVLIAGIGYTAWMWHKVIPGLAEHYQVIAFDNRGVGKSDKPEGPYTAEMLARDTVELMDALQIPSTHIFGHSMGGFIAQALALEYPERVDKLILSGTNYGGPRHIPITPEAMAILTDASLAPEERVKRGIVVSCAPEFPERQPEMMKEWVEYRVDHPIHPQAYQAQLAIGLGLISEEASFEKKLKNIQSPTLILFGEHDKVVPPGNAELLAKEIPDSTVEILPDAGHFFLIERPQATIDVIISFLKKS